MFGQMNIRLDQHQFNEIHNEIIYHHNHQYLIKDKIRINVIDIQIKLHHSYLIIDQISNKIQKQYRFYNVYFKLNSANSASVYLLILADRFLGLISRNEQRNVNVRNQQTSPYINNPISTSEHYPKGLSAFCTPSSPQQSNAYNTFAWPFSTNQNQKVSFIIVFSSQHFLFNSLSPIHCIYQ